MGNSGSKSFPVDTSFKFPSPLPSWPQGEGFASGIIDLGGLEVCQVTSFKKIWSTSQIGSNDIDVTFFEPSPIPNGFSMLGCYCQSNATPLFGWVLTGKDVSGGTLANPIDYTLVWNSTKSSCYIWLPTPPEGYKPVGYTITTSSTKPSLDKIKCVRADLTDELETDTLLWSSKEVNVYGIRPKVRGRQAQGVSTGTFIVEKIGDASSLTSLSCLKNNNFQNLTSSMPNLAQIDALIQQYSPRFYFHPKETYFPTSTKWYFSNGVQLYHTGEESNPIPVDPTGSNLPQDGSNDGTYWLDLPVDETERERVKKGDLKSCEAYLHVKPMLGATFTDLAIWIFYPFNGPSNAKLGLVDISLGKIGEHIGDWEHVTLRVSNFDGRLYRVYFAQHSGGMWVDTPSLEFLDASNKFAAYPSLNGHATYPAAGLVTQGTSVIGIRNDTAKSDMLFDVKENYSIMAAEYISDVIEPPWVNYTRKWGPKITYHAGTEIEKLQSSNRTVASAIGSLASVLPREFSSEDGPTGPKQKVDWDGDER
ncbi:vacuolar protein sorting-associated protein 62 [Artemisia annua]|uniref:Vacuolar protein sorting-associated protein 62 n=1 Tax=Artemisia annua TaxID=35608 RepID=A0A2U1PES4_ARTAN|nr:vacuolar protein sorting-associated protein 62 [Artemisia annua]